MSLATAVLLFCAAAASGAVNAVAGGGSFISFPALLFAGVPSVPANATSTIALWPGSVASAIAYRRELHDREVQSRLLPMGAASLVGGLAGSLLLLRTSDRTFVLLIPWLLLFAALVFSFGASLARRFTRGVRVSLGAAVVAQIVVGAYGGYFGGGMGFILLAIFSLLGMVEIHRMNALKTALAALVNGAAVVAFVAAGAVQWRQGAVMISGAIAGGYAGAEVARRISPRHVRAVVLVVAWAMTAYFFVHTYGVRSHAP